MGWLLNLAFWGATPAWARKLAVYGIIILAILYAGKLWLNSHDDKVRLKTVNETYAQIEKSKKEEWKKEQDQINQQKDALIQDYKNLDSQREQLKLSIDSLAQIRKTMDANYAKVLSAAQEQRSLSDEEISHIPPAELDGALRAKSAGLSKKAPTPIN